MRNSDVLAFVESGGANRRQQVNSLLMQIRSVYSAEYMHIVNSSRQVLFSPNAPRLGQYFDPSNVTAAAEEADRVVFKLAKLSFQDFAAEKPGRMRDRDNILDQAMSSECAHVAAYNFTVCVHPYSLILQPSSRGLCFV